MNSGIVLELLKKVQVVNMHGCQNVLGHGIVLQNLTEFPLFTHNHTFPYNLIWWQKEHKVAEISFLFLVSCSWHQTTKQTILFSLIFSTNFSHLSSCKRKKTFIGPKMRKNCFGPIKSLLSFSTAKTEKNSWKKFGENKIGGLVVWCHEQDLYLFSRNMSINDVKSLLQPVIHDSPKLKSDSESSLFDLGSPIKKQMSELVPPASPTLNSEQLTTESPPTKMAKRKNFDFGGLVDSEDNMIKAKRRRFQWYLFIY